MLTFLIISDCMLLHIYKLFVRSSGTAICAPYLIRTYALETMFEAWHSTLCHYNLVLCRARPDSPDRTLEAGPH